MKNPFVLFRQLQFFLAIRILIVEATRKLFDKDRQASYSQTGEDRIIDFYLGSKQRRDVFYVDIGCNEPFSMSNTMRLYLRGASGLAIDGNPEVIKNYQSVRPRDIAVCACVSDQVGAGTMVIAKRNAMSTVSAKFKEQHLQNSDVIQEISVNLVTANSILKKYNIPSNFDLLCIDVEGHDFEVLRSIDLSEYRPNLIVIELHNPGHSLADIFQNPILNHLKNSGYSLIAFATMNAYFLRQ